MIALFGLTFRDPLWLLLALAIPAALWISARGGRSAVRFAPAALWGGARMPRSWRVRLLPLPRVLAVLGLLGLVIALARPVRRTQLPPQRAGIDMMLCLDTSSSMASNDLDRRRTRLRVARDAAAQFIRARPDDRIGLMAFARFPELVCPPTLDHAALTTLLSGVSTIRNDSPEDATGLGAAVARAAQALGSSDTPSRVVIVFTDGEENVALAGKAGEISPVHAAQLCERLGVRVYPIVAGSGTRDRSGTWRPPDTRAVEHLAARTGGAFHEVRTSDDVAAVYSTIASLESAPFEAPRVAVEDRFLPFLVLALALLVVARVLAITVFEVTA